MSDAEKRFNERLTSLINNPILTYASGPAFVYHYASASGLVGLVSGQSVWASHATTLNDPGELKYIKPKVLQLLRSEISRRSDPSQFVKFENFVSETFALDEAESPVYVCCFCEEGDDLNLWRPYADDGRGYSIGFTLNSIGAGSWIHADGPAVRRKVVYDEGQQEEIILEALNAILDYIEVVNDNPDPAILGQFMEVMFECMTCFKHPAYRSEREWRTILVNKTYPQYSNYPLPVRFRPSREGVKPYIVLNAEAETGPFSSGPGIREIVIGPALDFESASKTVKLLLDQTFGTNAQSILIRQSVIPYRAP